MYILTRNGTPISKPHPHRITCWIEAIERQYVLRDRQRCWLVAGVEIKKVPPDSCPP